MPTSKLKIQPIELIDNNSIVVNYNEKVHIELEDMKDILNAIYEFTKKKPFKRLIVISKNSTITREARTLLQEENHLNRKNIVAEAVVVHSLAQKMATNFYLSFIKNDFPSKFFTDLNTANEWLKSH
ncbi:MAG: hypothetical protein PSX81_01100 [bacterium]|nr:hypothetical protein [bacterium]